MAQLRETSRRYNVIFGVDSTLLDFEPIIDATTLGRYRRATNPVIRQENFGLIFGSILAWLANYIASFDEDDHIQLSFISDSLPQDIVHPVCLVKNFNVQRFFGQIQAVLQSNEQFDFDASLRIRVEHIRHLRGGGRHLDTKKLIIESMEHLRAKKCVVIPHEDLAPGCCGPAALLFALVIDRGEKNVASKFEDCSNALKMQFNRECWALMRSGGVRNPTNLPEDATLSLPQMKSIIENNDQFNQYAVTVFSHAQKNAVVLKVNELAKKQIHLYLFNEIFCVITSLNSFFSYKNGWYCPACEKFCTGKLKHVCTRAVCQWCKCVSECKGEKVRCSACYRLFMGNQCFLNHRLRGTSELFPLRIVCESIMACTICKCDLLAQNGKLVEIDGHYRDAYKLCGGKKANHICYATKCLTCEHKYDTRLGKHNCYVTPLQGAKLEHLDDMMVKSTNWYLDIETAVHEDEQGLSYFKTNCVVIQSADLVPIEGSDEFEHPTEYFLGEDAIDKLAQFLFFGENSLLNSRKNHNIWAHNGGRFDWYPILGSYLKKGIQPSHCIIAGNTFKQICIGNLSFLDTKMFIPTALSKFSEIFDLTTKKGQFPHHFNRPENFNYEGNIPSIDQFDVRVREKPDFLAWYAEWQEKNTQGKKWKFKEEIIAYCEDDVILLRAGFEKFSSEVKELIQLKPGIGNCTLAGLANQAWRKKFVKWNEIGVVPETGYAKDIQSRVALQYLKYRNLKHFNGQLQFSGSSSHGEKTIIVSREVNIPLVGGSRHYHTVDSQRGGNARQHVFNDTHSKRYRVDGYFEESDGTKLIVEFYGCLFHGCLKCYAADVVSPFKNKTMLDLNMETKQREAELESEGYEIDSIWECEWNDFILNDNEVQQDLDEFRLKRNDQFHLSCLDPRDTLRGGRCGNTSLLHECEKGEQIMYVDFTSLYPAMMRDKAYPMDHPIIITSDFCYEKDAYFGTAKCMILPPKNLIHPVLPLKIKDEGGEEKLIFTLCQKCAETTNFELNSCQHSDEERMLRGSWVTPELYKAVEMGYEIIEFVEVWHYMRQSTTFFKGYIDLWFEQKAIAKREGNKTRYQIAKLFLNTLWGYFLSKIHRRRGKKSFLSRLESFINGLMTIRCKNVILPLLTIMPWWPLTKSRKS